MGFSDTDARFRPDLGTGGAPMGGPRYHFDPTLDSDRKFPAYYDNKWFIAEWNNGWIKTADLDAAGAMTKVDPFALGTGYKRPMDLDFGPDGALYVIEWGSGFGGDNADSGVYRIDYVAGDKAPIAEATASRHQRPRAAGGAVQLDRLARPRERSRSPTRGTSTATARPTPPSANPSYTYTTNGAYTAKLTVKDQVGLTGVENILITVGNRAPVVTIDTPLNGKLASFTDKIPYKISVTDPEDGTTGAGISCNDIAVKISLGHDEHAHDLSSATGCEGTLDRPGRRPRAGGQHLHGHQRHLHRQGRPGRHRPAHRPRRGDPAAQDQAGGVLRLHRPHAGRHRRWHAGRADRDDRRHRGRRLRTSASSRTATTRPTGRST